MINFNAILKGGSVPDTTKAISEGEAVGDIADVPNTPEQHAILLKIVRGMGISEEGIKACFPS